MAERNRIVILGGLSGASIGCLVLALLCPHRTDCFQALTEASVWVGYGGRIVLPTAALGILFWLVRLVWILARTSAWRRGLETMPPDPLLLEAVQRTGVRDVVQVRGDLPDAFCAGAVRPRIYVTAAALRRLRASEIDAVLLHEHDHLQRNEPLRRAAFQAACDVFFYVPLLRWLAVRRIEESELRADRTALDQVGRRPLAGALLALSGITAPPGTAAFAGTAELRVAQLLGEPIPKRPVAFTTAAASLLGLYLSLQVASCVLSALQHL